jgi:hypothetical protein
MPIVGILTSLVISSGQVSGDAFDDHGERPGLVQDMGLGQATLALDGRAAFGLEPTIDIGGLETQADMANDGDAPPNQEFDGFRHAVTGFNLDRLTARFLHNPDCRVTRLLGASFITPERQIDDDQGARRSAHDRAPMHDHHIEGGADVVGDPWTTMRESPTSIRSTKGSRIAAMGAPQAVRQTIFSLPLRPRISGTVSRDDLIS